MASIAHIGLDVHMGMIDVAVAMDGSTDVEYLGEIRNDQDSVRRLIKRLNKKIESQKFYYEAGPCGYGLYRYLTKLERSCEVIAPSLIPTKPGEKVKTNRLDAEKLARLGRAGELTSITVPSGQQEALRDVVRARLDATIARKHSQNQLLAFLRRYGHRYPGKHNFTKTFYEWLERIKHELPEHSVVLQDYIDAVQFSVKRIAGLEEQLKASFEVWELKPIGQSLMAIKGINFIAAISIMAEVGDFRRFNTAQEFMSYTGLVPSEYSSGTNQKRGAITKTGNSQIRRLLIECAWSSRTRALKTKHWKNKAQFASEEVQEMAWKATKRLHARFMRLQARGKSPNKVVTAVARELAGFVWAIGNHAYQELELDN